MVLNRLRISLKREPEMVVNRISISHQKLVYLICASRKIRYPKGHSPVLYIGTTKTGMQRVAQSAANNADWVLSRHGVNSFQVRIVTCSVRPGVRTWHKLERAFLLAFKEKYGAVPLYNTAGKNVEEMDEFRYFAKKRVKNILENLEQSGIAPDRLISA